MNFNADEINEQNFAFMTTNERIIMIYHFFEINVKYLYWQHHVCDEILKYFYSEIVEN